MILVTHRLPGQSGEPIDELDSACQKLARRHKCLELDFGPNSGLEFAHPTRPVCDYVQGYSFTFDEENGEILCGPIENPNYSRTDLYWASRPDADTYWNMNQCKYAICSMDLEFARQVADFFINPYEFWQENKSNKHISDTDLCQTLPGPKSDACCGSPEFRIPYSTEAKICCDDNVVERGSVEEAFCY